jgi:hypothetical protein
MGYSYSCYRKAIVLFSSGCPSVSVFCREFTSHLNLRSIPKPAVKIWPLVTNFISTGDKFAAAEHGRRAGQQDGIAGIGDIAL